MTVALRRLVAPPAGTLLAKLRAPGCYVDCFELSLGLALDSGSAPAVAAAAAAAPAMLAASPLLSAPPAAAAADAPLLANGDALTGYLRAFHTSAVFAPERNSFALMGLPPAPSVHELLRADFELGYRVGPFAVVHRGAVAAGSGGHEPARPAAGSGGLLRGSEAALGWGPIGGVAGLSYHGLLVRRTGGDDEAGGAAAAAAAARRRGSTAREELVFLFGSLLWRTTAAAAAPHAGAWLQLDGAAALLGAAAAGAEPPPWGGPAPPRLPLAWRALLPPHRVYSRLLLANAVDRHLRLAGLL